MSRQDMPLGWAIPIKVSLAGDESMSISDAQPTQVSLAQWAAQPNAPVDISAIPARIAEAAMQQSGAASLTDSGTLLPQQNVSAWDTETKVIVAIAALGVCGGAYYYHRKHKRR